MDSEFSKKMDLISLIDTFFDDPLTYEPYTKIWSSGFKLFNTNILIHFDVELIYNKIPRYVEVPTYISICLRLNDEYMLDLTGAIAPLSNKVDANEVTLSKEMEGQLNIVNQVNKAYTPMPEDFGENKEAYDFIKKLYDLGKDDSIEHPVWFENAAEIMQFAIEKSGWSNYYSAWFKSHTNHSPEFYAAKGPVSLADKVFHILRYLQERDYY